MDLGIAGRAAIVCGASQGMGRAIAQGLVEEGGLVTLCARDPEKLEKAAEELSNIQDAETVLTVAADLAEPESA